MYPAALTVALLAGVAWSCPEGFHQTDFDQCSSEIESSSWEEGRSKCAHSGGTSAVLAPTDFELGMVPGEIKLPKWALPKELGIETRSVDKCHVRPGCVTMNQTCHGLLSVKMTERGVCHEKIRSTDDESCNVVVQMGCGQSDWNATDKIDCFKHKEHFEPSINLFLSENSARVSFTNLHLLDDCWFIFAKLDTFENNTFDAVYVHLNSTPDSSVTFPVSNYDFKKGALWCQCFDKWTGLMVKSEVFSTGFSSQRCDVQALSRRWCVHVPPGDLKKAVVELDIAVGDVAASTSNVNDALRTLQRAFKSVHLVKGSNVSFEGDAVSALILPEAIGVKDDGSRLSGVVSGDTAEDLARVTNVSAAVVLPEPQPVAFLVYKNVVAFQDGVHRVVSPVVEVFADVTFVDLVLRMSSTECDRRCAFWDLQTGSWNSSGCHLRFEGEVNDVCRCDHLTTFAQIVTDTRFLTATDEVVLDHVSVLGCTASLLGALGTLLAAALSREWRSRKSTQVLLHLTAAVALRDALFVAAAREGRSSRASCVAVGVLLHYAEMAAGAWCVVAGALQVFRFATLSSRGITHLVLRCVLTAWPVAALPVVALLGALGPQVYAPGGCFAPGLCFPRGAPLLWAVTLPLGVATLANAGVFAFLVWTLCGFSAEKRNLKAARHGGPGLRAEALKCVVLFFLPGLPWLFGVPSGSRFLAYVFCVTATPQGLLLFLFFVLSNKSLRSSCTLTLKRNFAGYLENRKQTSDFSETIVL